MRSSLLFALAVSIGLVSIVRADILCCMLSPGHPDLIGFTYNGFQVLSGLKDKQISHSAISEDDYQCAKPGDYTWNEENQSFPTTLIPGRPEIRVHFCDINPDAVLQEGKLVNSGDLRMTYHAKRLLGDPSQHPLWSDTSKHVQAMQLALAAKKS